MPRVRAQGAAGGSEGEDGWPLFAAPGAALGNHWKPSILRKASALCWVLADFLLNIAEGVVNRALVGALRQRVSGGTGYAGGAPAKVMTMCSKTMPGSW